MCDFFETVEECGYLCDIKLIKYFVENGTIIPSSVYNRKFIVHIENIERTMKYCHRCACAHNEGKHRNISCSKHHVKPKQYEYHTYIATRKRILMEIFRMYLSAVASGIFRGKILSDVIYQMKSIYCCLPIHCVKNIILQADHYCSKYSSTNLRRVVMRIINEYNHIHPICSLSTIKSDDEIGNLHKYPLTVETYKDVEMTSVKRDYGNPTAYYKPPEYKTK
jgi:hypothetical protein